MKKNDKYDSEGMIGSYRTTDVPNSQAEGVVYFDGYGADIEDLKTGYCKPVVRSLPEYDKVNYYERWTVPTKVDESPGNTASLPNDFEFRMEGRESKGLFTRPRIPTER